VLFALGNDIILTEGLVYFDFLGHTFSTSSFGVGNNELPIPFSRPSLLPRTVLVEMQSSEE
jgi:hypothetical protein